MHVLDECNSFLRRTFDDAERPPSLVLEAGGGSFTHFALPLGARVVCLDISHGQLTRNTAATLRVQGDAQGIPLLADSVDMAICFNLLEHVPDPESVMTELVRCVRPGGWLLVGCPDRASLKGWITRLTPLSVHRLFYRFVVRKKDRGEGHYDAFATLLRPLVSSRALRNWIAARGMTLAFFRAYDGAAAYGLTRGSLLRRIVGAPYYVLGYTLQALTLGRWRALDSDLLLLAQKPAP